MSSDSALYATPAAYLNHLSKRWHWSGLGFQNGIGYWFYIGDSWWLLVIGHIGYWLLVVTIGYLHVFTYKNHARGDGY